MSRRNPRRVFVVVDVWRGIASDARCFANIGAARKCYRGLIKERNLMDDDVQIFATPIETQPCSG